MKYLLRQSKVFLMLFIMLVMTAHDAIPHVHNDPSLLSHDHLHDHDHHHDTPEKKEDTSNGHLASQFFHSFIETHSGANHSHYFSTPLNKPFKKSNLDVIAFLNVSKPQHFDIGLNRPKPILSAQNWQWEYCFLTCNSLRAPPFCA
jgi:hypothetical protein